MLATRSIFDISILSSFCPLRVNFLKWVLRPYGRHFFPAILPIDVFICFSHLSARQLINIKRRYHSLVTSDRDGFGIIKSISHNLKKFFLYCQGGAIAFVLRRWGFKGLSCRPLPKFSFRIPLPRALSLLTRYKNPIFIFDWHPHMSYNRGSATPLWSRGQILALPCTACRSTYLCDTLSLTQHLVKNHMEWKYVRCFSHKIWRWFLTKRLKANGFKGGEWLHR